MSDPFDLTGPAREPASGGKPASLVVFLHGYGADGEDLIGLAPHWQDILPDTAFLSPHAPFPCEEAPYGRQWFGFRGREEAALLAGTELAARILSAFIDRELAARGLGADRLALVGFSQGTMLGLHLALRCEQAFAGVVGYSGALIAPERLAQEIRSRPPVLLVHGDADPLVPFAAMDAAAQTLRALGVEVATERRPGLPHAIDPTGLAKGGRFLAERLGRRR
jgi:phospholipase/carboxylesterase